MTDKDMLKYKILEIKAKAFDKIFDICDDEIKEQGYYDILARQKFDEIKKIVYDVNEECEIENLREILKKL